MPLPFHKLYSIQESIVVDCPLPDTWKFFSNPHNLGKITPPSLNFRITTDTPETIYPGMIIRYLVSPFGGFDSQWVSEITHVDHQRLFVDEQRIGPYVFWHHEHRFTELNGSTEITDRVSYVVPGSVFGPVIHRLFIEQRLKEIFDFRREAVSRIFSKK